MSINAESYPENKQQSLDARIGERVHQLIWRARTTQKELSKVLGMTPATISRKIRGERAFSTEELVSVAKIFGVSIAVLFGEKENDPAGEPGRSDLSLHTESNRRPFHYNPNSNVVSMGARRLNRGVRRA